MRARSLSMAAVAGAAAMILSTVNCGGDGSTATGTGGKGGAGGHAGTGSAGTGSAGTGSAGTGSAGTGTAGTGTAGTGTAGTGTAGTGTAGTGAAGSMTDGGTDGGFPMVTIPDMLAVPAGATLKFRAHATGVQIYTCTASTPAADGGTDAGATTYSWVLKAPMADLSDETGTKIGTHYLGPTWKSTDGSDVVGAKVAGVDSPLSDAIQWLLLKVTSHMGSGVFADVTYVQRLNTTKGKAPATGCDMAAAAANMETSVAYTADYYFYKGGTDGGVTADWPFPTVTIPTEIAVPAGPTLKMRFHAIGVQIYTCTASGGADAGADAGATTYSWVLKAPDAKLYDDSNIQVGTHSAGPTWTSTDGSAITGTRLAAVNSPLSDAIQWLLLQAATHTGTGVFSDVTYVQRVNTTLGKAPATGCDSTKVNAEVRSDYRADYYFYKGDATADGGTGG